MRPINSALVALGVFLLSVGVSAQQNSYTAPARTQTAQTTGTPSGSAETTVSVKSLLDAKVLDSTNREMGTIRSFLIDPQSGKLVRADITLSGGGILGKGGEQQLSVPWEQLSVKRQEGNFVLVLNQQAMENVQSIQKQESSGKQDQQREQKSKSK